LAKGSGDCDITRIPWPSASAAFAELPGHYPGSGLRRVGGGPPTLSLAPDATRLTFLREREPGRRKNRAARSKAPTWKCVSVGRALAFVGQRRAAPGDRGALFCPHRRVFCARHLLDCPKPDLLGWWCERQSWVMGGRPRTASVPR